MNLHSYSIKCGSFRGLIWRVLQTSVQSSVMMHMLKIKPLIGAGYYSNPVERTLPPITRVVCRRYMHWVTWALAVVLTSCVGWRFNEPPPVRAARNRTRVVVDTYSDIAAHSSVNSKSLHRHAIRRRTQCRHDKINSIIVATISMDYAHNVHLVANKYSRNLIYKWLEIEVWLFQDTVQIREQTLEIRGATIN